MGLHDNSLLVYMSASVWTARRFDKGASTKLAHDANAVAQSARVNKHLLASADKELRDVSAAMQRARSIVMDNTLPWDDAGNRICSNRGVLKLVSAFEVERTEFYAAVDRFVAAYPKLREAGLAALGELANADDYPPVESVRDKFRLRLSLTPVAETITGAVREGITQQQVEAIEHHYQARVQEQQGIALAAAWERLRDATRLLVARLTPEDGKRSVLRDAVVDNLLQTTETLRGLNVFGSTELDSACQEVQSLLRGVTAKDLREGEGLAAQVRDQADALVKRLEGLLV